ncbi:MAG: hypothetical protein R3E39_12405 [Anaerolineae bacterium]
MPKGDTAETRAVTLVDVPLVKRLSENGMVLDSELRYTQDATGAHSASLITLLLPYRGVYTLITRAESQQVVGQFRLRHDDAYAQIAYVAPAPADGEDDTAWLHVLDAMAIEAGRRGAHLLTAEVEENMVLFRTMRTANYAIYARQEIWCRVPDCTITHQPRHAVELTSIDDDDVNGIALLYGNIVPKLVQPVTELPGVDEGFVYRKDDRVEGCIGMVEGRTGIYDTPFAPGCFQ